MLRINSSVIVPRGMIRVGPAGYPPGSKGPVDAVERVAAMGFSAMEVQFVRQVRMDEAKAAEAGRRARRLDVTLSAHAPYYINFCSPNQATREKSVDWVLRSVRLCHILGAWLVVVHAASYSGNTPGECSSTVTAALRRCRRQMVEEGIDSVKIGLETMGKSGSWGTLREIREVMGEVQGVVPVLDFAHIHARNGGSLRTGKDFEKVLKELFSFYDGRLHCHFSCIEYTEKGEKRHLPLQAKEPDFRPLARLLREGELDATLISETPPPEDGAVEMLRMLRSKG
jgi:deoxyribonuclease-4